MHSLKGNHTNLLPSGLAAETLGEGQPEFLGDAVEDM
jgi:hypothetical protein